MTSERALGVELCFSCKADSFDGVQWLSNGAVVLVESFFCSVVLVGQDFCEVL